MDFPQQPGEDEFDAAAARFKAQERERAEKSHRTTGLVLLLAGIIVTGNAIYLTVTGQAQRNTREETIGFMIGMYAVGGLPLIAGLYFLLTRPKIKK